MTTPALLPDLHLDAHPLLELEAFVTRLPAELSTLFSPASLLELLSLQAPAPLRSSEALRAQVRDLLRHGGFKPTGRSKPASEYLIRAANEAQLGPINLVVDACNAVSLHSGLPISVVDLEVVEPPLWVRIAPPGSSYVFNVSGQEIDVGGLLCLCDAQGPCANAVKDAQRTKTRAQTRTTLSLIWGTRAQPGYALETARWYRGLLEAAGATTEGLAGVHP